jgi:hypothetical protein
MEINCMYTVADVAWNNKRSTSLALEKLTITETDHLISSERNDNTTICC